MKKSILIVDDDETIRRLIIRLLEKEGYTAIVANNGREGLEKYDKSIIGLVITDIIMPDMEGIEFIISLKKLNPEIKIIAISGGGYLPASDYLETAKDFGVIESFSKPFDIMALINKVKESLNLE